MLVLVLNVALEWDTDFYDSQQLEVVQTKGLRKMTPAEAFQTHERVCNQLL